MPRWFNTAGPCREDIHYVLPATRRIPSLERLIAQENYFVIHAPRQVGKTTAMLALAKQLTESGQYTAVMLSVEVGAPFSQDIAGAEEAILGAWRDNISVRLPPELQPPDWTAMHSIHPVRLILKCDRLLSEILMLQKSRNSTRNIPKIPDKFLHLKP